MFLSHLLKNTIITGLIFSSSNLHAAWNNAELDLFDPIGRGDYEKVEQLCAQGADVDQLNLDNDRKTPLLVCFSEDIFSSTAPDTIKKIIQTLINHKARVNKLSTETQVHSLLAATRCRDFDSALLLLQHGAIPEYQNIFGFCPLVTSLQRGCPTDFYEELLKKMHNKKAINRKYGNPTGAKFLLTYALEYNRGDAVQLLLNYGADCTIRDKNNNGVMHCTHRFSHDHEFSLEGTSLILQAGANPNLENNEGDTPLDHAVSNCNFDLVKQFLLSPSKIPLSKNTVFKALTKKSNQYDSIATLKSFYIEKILTEEIKVCEKFDLLAAEERIEQSELFTKEYAIAMEKTK